jgi:hypothetical protein
MRSLLLLFEAVSGLKTNLAESELVLVGYVDNVVELAWILGCRGFVPAFEISSSSLGGFPIRQIIFGTVLSRRKNID